jgi:hypothetical protein
LCCWWFDRGVDCVVDGLLEEWIVLLWIARGVDCVVGSLIEEWIVLVV